MTRQTTKQAAQRAAQSHRRARATRRRKYLLKSGQRQARPEMRRAEVGGWFARLFGRKS